MGETNAIFISDKNKLDSVLQMFKTNMRQEEYEGLVSELYQHIEHTRRVSFRNGYEQGKFDEKMDQLEEMP